MTTATQVKPKAGPREWLGLFVLTLPTILLALDATVLNLAVPHLSADLEPTGAELLWIVDIYGFMIAGFLLTMGALGDHVGRRRLLMIGAVGFGAASVLAALATTPAALIAARALLGVTGATLMPSTLALLTNMFKDPRQRGVALSVWVTCFSVGTAVGPVLGGMLLAWFEWGSVFLLAVPVMVLLLVTAPLLLPEFKDADAGRIDLASVVLSLGTVLPVIYGIKRLAEHGVDAAAAGAILLGLAVGMLFVMRQRRSTDPLLDLRLFANRAFSASLLVLLLGLGLMGGLYLFITQYLQSVAGLPAFRAGLWLLPAAAALIVASSLTPVLVRRIRPAYVIGGALLLSVPGYFMIAVVDSGGELPMLVTGFVLIYAGISPMMVLGTDLVVGSAPPERAGSAAAVSESGMEFGIAMGVAALGSVVTSVYRSELGDTLPPNTSEATRDASLDTLAGAETAVGALPDPMRLEVLELAREAFTNGMNLAAGIAGSIVAVLAIVAIVLLRHVPTSGAGESTDTE
ncbi:MFS transporter, DHA2 family, multidrug resistance protein [Promicromonospora umidemergens]|uniref:MFS transporter n=1 Tax=Promicromonospora umidemergens TaxID=629679 RepID=A0ABP8XF85_9MICO|nr:MFS transporter [Promicromonospora umidemergens]MCP2281787.1 MFS transporter, DHA2 family, multidrug resistance protein [Promicromonospora umidemergens]